MSKKDDAQETADKVVTDETQSDAEIWNELDAEEAAAKSGEEADAAVEAVATETKDDVGEKPAASAESTEAQGEKPETADAKDERSAGGDESPGAKAAPAKGGKKPAQASEATEIDWSKAPPEFRTAHDELVAEKKRLEQSDKSNRGRVSALQRQLDENRRQSAPGTREQTKDGKTNGTATGKPAAFQTEKGKKLREEYPEIVEPMAEEIEGLKSDVQALREKALNDAIAEQEGLLEDQHSDWQTVTATPAFKDWYSNQLPYVKAAVERNAEKIVDASEAGDVITRFKAFRSAELGETEQAPKPSQDSKGNTGSLSDRRRRQLESSSAARSNGPGAVHGAPPDDADEATHWKYFDEQERRKTGRA